MHPPRTTTRDLTTARVIAAVALVGAVLWSLLMMGLVAWSVGDDVGSASDGYIVAPGPLRDR